MKRQHLLSATILGTTLLAISLKITFLTDPVGTCIEVTEGLDDVE